MDRYRWNILGLCEMRWKNFGGTTTEEGHKVFFSGKEDKHEHGVGFLVHMDIVNTVMGCRPVSSRLRAVPFIITIVQAYAPTSDYKYNDNNIEEFYDQLQNVTDQTPKKGILVVQGDWNTKWRRSSPKPQAEKIIAEEQAGFRAGRSTTEQIFNLRILCEKYLQHQQDLYHVFINFKKAFDRVWHAALLATMKKYNISTNLTQFIKNLYNKAASAVLFNSSIGDWF